MLKNYFIIAWRNIRNHKLFSAINILGLSAGLCCCILIFLFIQNELSYDQFHVHAKNIVRLSSEAEGPNGKTQLAVTPAPWAPLMKKDYPEIRNYVRLLKDEKIVIGPPGGQHFYETGMLYADSTFFAVFSVDLERGDRKRALDQANSIVLTRETARKYFGDSDPIGKTLEVNSFGRTFTVEVTAIAKDLPSTSHFHFNSLVSLQTLGDLSALWSFHMFQSYLLLNDQNDAAALEKKLSGFVNKYIIGNPKADGKQDIHLQPLTSIHLHSQMTGELEANGNSTYVYVFAGVALFILLIACFNFTNLSTARSLTRAKEVGLRKVVGAERKQLLRQFLGETSLFAVFALVAALIAALLILPLFSRLSGRTLTLDLQHNFTLLIFLILLVVAVGLLAGLYPAAVLSAFKPVEVLKGRFIKSSKGVSFRKLLVTLQFVVSIALIASTLLVNRQLDFLKNKELGFDRENILVLTLPRNSDSTRLNAFKASLLEEPVIRSASATSSVPGTNIAVNQVNNGGTDLTKALSMQMLFTDEDFVRTMKMKLVAGRDFASDHPTDKTQGFILNEEAVKKLGWRSAVEAIGKTIQWVQPNVVLKEGRVVGVVQNFHITPLKASVQPLVMHYFPQRFQYVYVRFNQQHGEEALSIIKKTFNEFFARQSFEYSFLDDQLNAMYSSEKKLGTIFSYFSLLAIIIACLGVLGLSLYSIQQRMKEIGVKKLLGASVFRITGELLKDFVRPVLIAALIATPLAWYAMNKWLEDFAYRIQISWTIFLITTIIVLCLAVLTMGIQSVKAALSSPVKNLRTE